jgi:hypothetical protein
MKECVKVLLWSAPDSNEYKLAEKYISLKLNQDHRDILLGNTARWEISQRNDLLYWKLLIIEGQGFKLTLEGEAIVKYLQTVGGQPT